MHLENISWVREYLTYQAYFGIFCKLRKINSYLLLTITLRHPEFFSQKNTVFMF